MDTTSLWQAVADRDTRADGLFVYAVRSTGVYCRPSCVSRRPRPAGVEFFPTPAMAAAAGYRACLRCHPDTPAGSAPALARVRRACAAVARRPEARWTSAAIARAAGTSIAQLQRTFRRVLHISPRDYVSACRRQKFLGILRNGRRVTDAIYESGYGSPSRVYGAIRLPGMTPAAYGRGGRGARIRWLTVSSPIGRLLVASTDRGLCFVEIGTSDASLLASLRREFPVAAIGDEPAVELGPIADAARAVAGAGSTPDSLPLDIRGTAFQWRVWRALTSIPRGETRSYADLARAIGQPSAARAVARACATNPIALLVPCHRVTLQDGSIGGYRWGTAVKQTLLDVERGETDDRPAAAGTGRHARGATKVSGHA
jgi:AraC family transcriptional regulator of adaptative response/methylated-DNA-[protein]-cysteine methyltransferase